MTAKVLFTGKTHTTNGHDGAAHGSDGFLDIKLPGSLTGGRGFFGAAWSACYMGALELAASHKKIKLPAQVAVDAQIDLNLEGASFFLAARLDVSLPGLDREVGGADPGSTCDLPLLQGRARQYRCRDQSRLIVGDATPNN